VTGAVTIELNPFNVIAGRYVWGHRAVEQGDAGTLRRTRIGGTDLSAGGQAAAIFVRYALEHFRDLRQVFAEFAHVLKPGGKVVLIVGQTFDAERESGDMHAFPTVESVYAAADDFAPVHFELHRNNDTQRDEFMVCLVKPDTGGAVTRRESAARAVRAAPVGLWSRARVGVAWRWCAWRQRARTGGAG
jgi:SAM-dependent methyltransferase